MIRNLYILFIVSLLNTSVFAQVGRWQTTLRSQGKTIEVKENVFYGQCGQDKFIYETYFKDKKDGIFVEFGAADGVYLSNSLFFEKTLGWKGLLIEPIPYFFEELEKNRPNAICVHGCVSDKRRTVTFLQAGQPTGDPKASYTMLLSGILEYMPEAHLQRIKWHMDARNTTIQKYPINCYILSDLLDENNFQHIDYLSIDVECAELGILKTIDFDKYDIDVIGVEGTFESHEIKRFLISRGYDYVCKKGDHIFKKRDNS